ncbi:MAG: DUF2142 domain-containing protein, partial [Methanobrevibacter sp.]|nr:DUF2142 domain-containing protein [Candidatus Methanovirga australis]
AFKDNKINKKDIALLAICVLALSLSKQLYALLGLLFFIIPNSKFNSIKVKLIYFLLMFLPSIFFVLLQYNTIIGFLNHFIGVTPVLSISNPLQPPINPFLFRLSNSILIGGNFYLTSFIGSFGWATNPLPLIIVYSYVILLILFSMIDLSMFKEKVPEKFKKIVISQKIVSLLIFFIGIIFIFFAASNWTINGIVPPYFIFGVRGRYFIPLAPLLFLTLQNKKIRNYFYRKSSNNIRTHLDFFIIIFMGIILIVSTYYLSIIGLSTYSNFHQIM